MASSGATSRCPLPLPRSVRPTAPTDTPYAARATSAAEPLEGTVDVTAYGAPANAPAGGWVPHLELGCAEPGRPLDALLGRAAGPLPASRPRLGSSLGGPPARRADDDLDLTAPGVPGLPCRVRSCLLDEALCARRGFPRPLAPPPPPPPVPHPSASWPAPHVDDSSCLAEGRAELLRPGAADPGPEAGATPGTAQVR